MASRTDLELVEAFRSGDVTGFNELVRRYQQKVYWIARRTLGTHEEADDAAQDVFVRVYEKLKDFRGESNFYTWLYRVAMNVSLNALRRKRIREFLPYDDVLEETLPSDAATDAQVETAEFETLLERAVQTLPAKQKAVFIMRYHDELSYEEMSAIVGTSVGGLKANYFHALRKIQEFVRRETGQ